MKPGYEPILLDLEKPFLLSDSLETSDLDENNENSEPYENHKERSNIPQ